MGGMSRQEKEDWNKWARKWSAGRSGAGLAGLPAGMGPRDGNLELRPDPRPPATPSSRNNVWTEEAPLRVRLVLMDGTTGEFKVREGSTAEWLHAQATRWLAVVSPNAHREFDIVHNDRILRRDSTAISQLCECREEASIPQFAIVRKGGPRWGLI